MNPVFPKVFHTLVCFDRFEIYNAFKKVLNVKNPAFHCLNHAHNLFYVFDTSVKLSTPLFEKNDNFPFGTSCGLPDN